MRLRQSGSKKTMYRGLSQVEIYHIVDDYLQQKKTNRLIYGGSMAARKRLADRQKEQRFMHTAFDEKCTNEEINAVILALHELFEVYGGKKIAASLQCTPENDS